MQLSPRQVHLDFHTSEKIPGIGERFHAEEFATTASAAEVTSMTVFARCHHGWLYYPSKRYPQLIHPELADQNLLLEQVRALHSKGIKAPVYITVQWDYQTANSHPEWLIRAKNGAHNGRPFTEAGFYQALCLNTGYTDFLKEITAEVCELLGDELDGLFFDIVGVRPCWCSACRKEMKALGVDANDDDAVTAFTKMVIDRFRTDMTAYVRKYNSNCTVFYNAGHIGPCTRESADSFTHFELESLPSGGWGYLHFPVTARYARTFGKDCMGMTGKFHTSWADFHSLKNPEALEFECFRMMSFGFAASVGDQLEPNGRLNPATYRLIGHVFRQMKEREEWARPSKVLVEAALLTSESPLTEGELPDSVLGAAQMLEELALQFDIIDTQGDLNRYSLLILPDDFTADVDFQRRLDAYVEQGGKIIACAKGGLSSEEKYPDCFGSKYLGMEELYPNFIVAQGKLGCGLEQDNEYVIYQQGVKLEADGAAEILGTHEPYFVRNGEHFCSHSYTPSSKQQGSPAVLQKNNVIQFAHPLFSQYRANAPKWCKTLLKNALDLLLPNRLICHDGPSTLLVSLLEQAEKNRACLHILSYIPVRKSVTIDVIEERTVVTDCTLKLSLPRNIKSARLVPENIELPIRDGELTVPKINGYAIVELNYAE